MKFFQPSSFDIVLQPLSGSFLLSWKSNLFTLFCIRVHIPDAIFYIFLLFHSVRTLSASHWSRQLEQRGSSLAACRCFNCQGSLIASVFVCYGQGCGLGPRRGTSALLGTNAPSSGTPFLRDVTPIFRRVCAPTERHRSYRLNYNYRVLCFRCLRTITEKITVDTTYIGKYRKHRLMLGTDNDYATGFEDYGFEWICN